MSRKEYTPRKHRREGGRANPTHESEHSRSSDKKPEAKKESEKGGKEEGKEVLPSPWSEWLWESEAWYYWRARKGDNGKWQYEFESYGPQALTESSTSTSPPTTDAKPKDREISSKPVENLNSATNGNDGDKAPDGYQTGIEGLFYNFYAPYLNGIMDNAEQKPPEPPAKPLSPPLVDDLKEVKEGKAKEDEKKPERVERRERGRTRERKTDLVTEWRQMVEKESGGKSDEGSEKAAPKSRKRKEKYWYRERSYYNTPSYSDYFTLSE
ncbi:hypothetical protein HYALB_00005447 [Hymenoscyphus albidus]|uniref:Uncharacterized protein n=1 Tax=Hymenoscyphus albidus TaxID=595503 RepID=A0A9N9Q2Y4_9HELO|nr:hypothetical protein HYALB_00005447 [Hymenoscyphus albidus]